MLAPPIIHQIWMQGWDNHPPKFDDNITALHAMNPEFLFMTWDEKSIEIECEKLGPTYAAKYRSFPHMISRVDYGRYVLLYLHGGISVDLDMKPLKPIRSIPELAKHDFIISSSAYPFGDMGLINNAVLIVTPKHPLLLDFLNRITELEMREENYLNRDMYIHNTTGPLILSNFVEEHPQEIFVLDHEFFEPCLSVDPYCKVPEKAIMDHQHELSWMSPFLKSIVVSLFYILHNWQLILFFVVMALSVYVGVKHKVFVS
jgi:mannosyltransferase OCH1-like enzyme